MVSANGIERIGSLRAMRKAAGLSQQQVAELARCSVSYVRLLESGFRPETDSHVMPRIAAALRGVALGTSSTSSEAARDGGSATTPVTAGNGEA